MTRIEIEWIDPAEERSPSEHSTETFNRIAFAERAVALVKPARTRVVIRAGARRVRLDGGRQWGDGVDSRWAVLSVPQDASRETIALAVLGLHRGASRPWALDVLMTALGPLDREA